MCKVLVPQVWLIFSGFSVLPNGYGTRVYVRKFVRQGAHTCSNFVIDDHFAPIISEKLTVGRLSRCRSALFAFRVQLLAWVPYKNTTFNKSNDIRNSGVSELRHLNYIPPSTACLLLTTMPT